MEGTRVAIAANDRIASSVSIAFTEHDLNMIRIAVSDVEPSATRHFKVHRAPTWNSVISLIASEGQSHAAVLLTADVAIKTLVLDTIEEWEMLR